MLKDLKEKLYRKKIIYNGRTVSFCADEILLPNGKKVRREYLKHPGAAAVIPFIDDKNIILVQQFRYPVGKATYEIPAGKIEKGESPVKCVKRELSEETGYTAVNIKKLISYWPTPAFSNEVLHIYCARGLKPSKISPDEDEFLRHKILPFSRVLRWVKSGRIMDSKTIIAVLLWQNLKDIRN